jgi:hypothetical protein
VRRSLLGGDAQEAEPLVGEHALQRDDRVARRPAIELDLGQDQARGEPIAVRPRDRGRRLEAGRRPSQSFSALALRPSFISRRNW